MESEFIRCWRETDDGNHTRVYYNITNDQWNCAEHYGHCDSCPKLQGDPDIAGIGVFIAFMVSVSITALLGIIFPILSAALRPKATAIHDCLDILLEKAVRITILKRLGIKKAERWALICYNSVFSLGDQQLTTAFALLVATLKKLYSDQSLSVYHLKLVMNLACLSNCVYAYAIISLRIKMDLQQPTTDRAEGSSAAPPRRVKNKQPMVNWSMRLRSILMFTVTALLLYTGWIAARVDGLEPNCPAMCFKKIPAKGEAAKVWATQYWIPIYYTLTISFTQCLAMSRKRCYLLQKKKVTEKNRSNLFEILGVCGNLLLAHAFFVYYLYRVAKSWRERNQAWYVEADIQNEESWGFGQVVPILLLIQPVLQLLDSISETEEEHDQVERGTQTESRTEHEVEYGPEGRSDTPSNMA
ncbi:hypothetical protein B0T13DRAFT_225238 [Neurospora crassa]|nr:hypothetical protein B0T13DRAFT_225238 [Neurospora crassa]